MQRHECQNNCMFAEARDAAAITKTIETRNGRSISRAHASCLRTLTAYGL